MAHGIAAAVLFLCLSLFPLWLFKQSRERTALYNLCGGVMLLSLALIAACGDGRAGDDTGPPPGLGVASFNFAESRLVAEIYAQALEGEGIEVRRELDLGPRELVQPALRQGLVDVVPEYLGSALTSVDPAAEVDASAPAEELVARAAETARTHDLKHLLWEMFERCRADYGANSSIFFSTRSALVHR